MRTSFPPEIEKILSLVQAGSDFPLGRLERGKPLAKGREAVVKTPLPPLVQAVLYLYFDCFDEAHDTAQNHEGTPAGNWIHAIVHRREPDASNSKYWYHRVNLPPKWEKEITRNIAEWKGEAVLREWNSNNFVDLCEKFRKKDPADPTYQALAGIQQVEWEALLKYVLASSD